MTSEPLRISAKTLGELAMPTFCQRCQWIKLHADSLPFQGFPSIFSSIDSYTKKVLHHLIETHGQAPDWLSPLGPVSGFLSGSDLHHSRYKFLHAESNVLLTGAPDDIFITPNGTHLVIDYKTAKFTANQDKLSPIYRTQLNGYAYIAEQTGRPVSGLALVYFEPQTDEEHFSHKPNHRESGFAMGFSAHILPVELNLASIPPLLRQARELYDQPAAPAGREGCKDCQAIQELLRLNT